jgi:hypothetical protein
MDTELVVLLAVTVAGILKYLLTSDKFKIATIENDALSEALYELKEAVYDAVVSAEGTIVAAAKADNDGKLTPEEADRIKAEVIENSKAILSIKSKLTIEKHFDDDSLEKKVATLIERYVRDRK